jgi:UDP-N-acetylglucosamine--N-acetylmuramyl-(pentapeptide) pyrophosphoryl-undecaprenol N-acetylglucosamine transferase
MTASPQPTLRIALACGGTGGHLFPGLAVAEVLSRRACVVTLIVSPKEVDQRALENVQGIEVLTLPAIGLTRGRRLAFVRAFWQSYRAAREWFRKTSPNAVLAMGGFTAAAPLVAGKRAGAATFIHESNTIPGRANRWLSRMVDGAFVGFPSAADRLRARNVTVTGTPVRSQFTARDAAYCRRALGLEPNRPVVLIMGGSQGAHGINSLVLESLPSLVKSAPDWQWLHLTGPDDYEPVKQAYASARVSAAVHPFFDQMELALGAAAAALSRAGASSLAELAAVRVPSVLIPYPAATDNHQLHNARAFVETGAALMLEQNTATAEILVPLLVKLMQDSAARESMQTALAQWHRPDAADQIVAGMLDSLQASAHQRDLRIQNDTGRSTDRPRSSRAAPHQDRNNASPFAPDLNSTKAPAPAPLSSSRGEGLGERKHLYSSVTSTPA